MERHAESVTPRKPVSGVVYLIKDNARVLGESAEEGRLLSYLLIRYDESVEVT
jgi:hypothetical protein